MRKETRRVLHAHGEQPPQYLAELVGSSKSISSIRTILLKIADANASVLITGPSGSGKDVAAQLLHQRSRRAARPFVALNCAAVPADLLESELFGHEQGAFTGATRARAGRFEAANGGTLFLDEIGDMPLAMQAKLLRTLETRVVERVGGMLPIALDVRVIAATSVDLAAAVAQGRFRTDLFYRLDVIHVSMPALADHAEDVPALVQHFLRQQASPARFTTAALEALGAWPWPGNVRELRNFVERACVHHGGEVIGREALDRLLRGKRAPDALAETALAETVLADAAMAETARLLGPDGVDLKQLLADLERAYIRAALEQSGGTISHTAKLLRLQRTTLIEKMRRLEIDARAA
ncbi:MAG: sigma-54 dependent transcriptional regulator [Alphaproteobacteria bacterium]|nr:sigma-54 dependent transcriptional regulator [Alphaproteobacteria bacterium]